MMFRFHFQHLGRGERARICGAKYIGRGNSIKEFVVWGSCGQQVEQIEVPSRCVDCTWRAVTWESLRFIHYSLVLTYNWFLTTRLKFFFFLPCFCQYSFPMVSTQTETNRLNLCISFLCRELQQVKMALICPFSNSLVFFVGNILF